MAIAWQQNNMKKITKYNPYSFQMTAAIAVSSSDQQQRAGVKPALFLMKE